MVRDDEVPPAGRYVDSAVVLELQQHRMTARRGLGEVESHDGPDHLRLAGRLEVHVEDQVGVAVDPPGHVRWLGDGGRAGLPEEEVAVGLEALGFQLHVHAAEPGARVARVQPPRGPGAVEQDVRVVHDGLVARAQLERPHVARRRHRDGDHEVAEHVRAFGGHRERLRHLQHQVRRPELPALRESRRRGPVCRGAFRSALAHPPLYQLDLLVAEAPLALELAVARLGGPRRHVSAGRHPGDLPGPALHIGVGEQAEGPGFARPMARRAVLEHDRGDVRVEGDSCRLRPLLRARGGCASAGHARQEQQRAQRRAPPALHSARDRKQPTAVVVRRVGAWPAAITSSTCSRSCVVGAARARPNSRYRSSMRPR
jgi:hypothetical protein